MMSVCWCVGAGDFYADAFAPRPGDLVIAADGGAAYLARIGARADLMLGDFDSLGAVPAGENVRRFPPEKDDTDMILAVKEGLSRGYARFALLGGLGGRLSHTLANIQTLVWLSRRDARGVLSGEGECVTAVTDGELTFGAFHSGYVSVFCLGEPAEGVTLEGLKYPLKNARLECSVPLGVSNEFLGRPSRVRVEKGSLVVVWAGGFDEILRG